MLYISLDQEIQYPFYDDDLNEWRTHTDTIGNLLKDFVDYRNLKIIDLDEKKWGKYEKTENRYIL